MAIDSRNWPTSVALRAHGGPKFSPDGRFVYFASRDGWVSVYDLHNLTMLAEVRAGLNTRNPAVSNDGRWVLVGNYLPGNWCCSMPATCRWSSTSPP